MKIHSRKNITKYLLVASLFFSHAVMASTSFDGKGKVMHSEVEMQLTVDDAGNVDGHYLYVKTRVPIKLVGLLSESKITLKTADNPDINEEFVGEITINKGEITKYEGRWYGKHGAYGSNDDGYPFSILRNINPLDDKQITCQEMENYPEVVFQGQDLGSGHGSPIDVDYHCPKSLSELNFLKSLLSMADGIRTSDGRLPSHCSGSIIHAQWRYYHFALAWLGYDPQTYEPWKREDAYDYFAEWGYQSLYNREIYEKYMTEMESVRPVLTQWYIDNHGVSKDLAASYATKALDEISMRGFGSYSSYYYGKREELVPFTHEAIGGNFKNFNENLVAASDVAKLNSLRRLMVNDAASDDIKRVLDSIKVYNLSSIPNINGRSESPLSIAIKNPEYLTAFLNKGFDLDHQNYFGKTALFYAIQYGVHDAVKMLIDKGSDVNHKYKTHNDKIYSCSSIQQWYRTPLMHAAQHSDVDMLQILLDAGAKLTDRDVVGNTPVDYAIMGYKDKNKEFLLERIKEKIPADISKAIDDINTEGEKLLTEDRYMDARNKFLDAADLDKSNIYTRTLNNLSVVSLRLEDFESALKYADTVIKMEKDKEKLAEAYFNFGRACYLGRTGGKSVSSYCLTDSSLRYFLDSYDANPTKFREEVIVENIMAKHESKYTRSISCFENPPKGVHAIRFIGSYLFALVDHDYDYSKMLLIESKNDGSTNISDKKLSIDKKYEFSDGRIFYKLLSPDVFPQAIKIDDSICRKEKGGINTFTN